MQLEKYINDLDEFIKERLTYFVSEYYIGNEKALEFSGHILRDFLDGELRKVTFSVDNAYVRINEISGDRNLIVTINMGDNATYNACLRLKESALNFDKGIDKTRQEETGYD